MADTLEVRIPDIGDFHDVSVIEVMVKPGDRLQPEDPMLTVESDKATMDVPSPAAGTVTAVHVKVGDKVSEGSMVLLLETAAQLSASEAADAAVAPAPSPYDAAGAPTDAPPPPGEMEEPTAPPPVVLMPGPQEMVAAAVGTPRAHASPAVRRLARELGVEVCQVTGSGPQGRILKEDVQTFVQEALAARPPAAGGLDLPPWPSVDHARFGSIETRPLSRIRKLSGANLARNWVMIPHVTHFDQSDITELEQFRLAVNKEQETNGVKLTLLAFVIRAAVAALKRFPEFNSSIDGENLILKHYFHIGFAADTPNGLVVPVIKDADTKSLLAIARAAADLARQARDGQLSPAELQGGCFTISSLGGVGGTAFTPIINAPEVAILGVSRAETKPRWNGTAFAPRLMLPLSLSYDHRVIDGAAAARFVAYLCEVLADIRRALL